jgi:hypothetical protein
MPDKFTVAQVAANSESSERLRIFVSYARVDASDFAEYLVVALRLAGFDAYLDRHDIAKAEDWESRLSELINGSDTVVFVITPASVKSPRCEWEVSRAIALGKRLVPVQWMAVSEAEVPASLKRLNYAIFSSGQPFSGPLAELSDALRQDLVWLRKQTQLTEAAERWNRSDRSDDLLLRGATLVDARLWANQRKSNAPEISPSLVAFIGAGEEAETARNSKEKQRLVEIAAAQAQREQALAAAEANRYWRRVVTVSSFVIVSGLLALSLWQWQKAVQSQRAAVRATAVIDIIEGLLEPSVSGAQPSSVTLTAIRNMKKLAAVEIKEKAILWFDPKPPNNQYEELAFKKMGFKVDRAVSLDQAQQMLLGKYDLVISHFGRSGSEKENSNAYRLLRWRDANGVPKKPVIVYAAGGAEFACAAQRDGFYDETDDAYDLFSTVLLAIQNQAPPDRCLKR